MDIYNIMTTIIQELMADSDRTTIQIRKRTRDRLDSMGKRRESYDLILNRLMDIIEGKAKK
jgi:hypothetical protein